MQLLMHVPDQESVLENRIQHVVPAVGFVRYQHYWKHAHRQGMMQV